MVSAKTEALYIHIPFCDELCPYCDFCKVKTGTFSSSAYIKRLLQEIESYSIPKDSLKTIYIGGGTPSALPIDELKTLLSYLAAYFSKVEEFTLEANPESLDLDKIQVLRENHVNRVSLGVQSASISRLSSLHRKHSPDLVAQVVKNLKDNGIENINLDFIYGLPDMKDAELKEDIRFALSLKPTHLSFYSLQIEKGTQYYAKKIPSASEEEMARQYQYIVSELTKHGYQRYEISNFALPGFESRHNLTYWHDQTYYACGASASGYLNNQRYVNTKSIRKYISLGPSPETETLSKEDEELEFLMLHLRLSQGFSLQEYEERFQKSFLGTYASRIQRHADAFQVKNGYFSLKEENLYIMDYFLLDLIS